MKEFKVSDWVRFTPSNEVFKIHYLDNNIVTNTKHNGHYDIDFVELWQPQVGEWCWFWDFEQEIPKLMQFKEMFNGDLFTSIQDKIEAYTYCEPFIGELPSFIKDKQ